MTWVVKWGEHYWHGRRLEGTRLDNKWTEAQRRATRYETKEEPKQFLKRCSKRFGARLVRLLPGEKARLREYVAEVAAYARAIEDDGVFADGCVACNLDGPRQHSDGCIFKRALELVPEAAALSLGAAVTNSSGEQE